MSNAATPGTTQDTETIAQAKLSIGTMLVPVLASTMVTLGVITGAMFALLRAGKVVYQTPTAVVSSLPPVIVVAPPASHVTALEPIIVNLSDASGRSYLRAGVSLRIRDEQQKQAKTGEKQEPKGIDPTAVELRDTTLAVLGRQTSDKLLSPNGRETLKEELQKEYKQRNTDIPVLEVFFTEFLVQRG